MISNITLIVTSNCNLSCLYCFCGKKSAEIMSFDIAKKAVDILSNESASQPLITFFGGEPLIEIDLINKVCAYAKSKICDVRFSLTTNGTLLNEKEYEIINKWNIRCMVSVDGLECQHDANRTYIDKRGSWQDIMSNLLKMNTKPCIRLTFTSENISHLSENVIGLHKMGFHEIVFSHSIYPLWNEESCKEYQRQFSILAEYYVDCFEKGEKISFVEFDDIIFSYIMNRKRSCFPGINQIAICPDGSIIPCHRVNFSHKEFVLSKNIMDEDSFENNSLDAKKWKMNLSKTDNDCEGCAFIERCTSCRFENIELTKSAYIVPGVLCYFNKVKISLADKVASTLYKEKNKYFMERFYKNKIE